MPSNEFGIFYTKDCYVFLCRYYVSNEDESDFSDEESGSGANESGSSINIASPGHVTLFNTAFREKNQEQTTSSALFTSGMEGMQVIWDG